MIASLAEEYVDRQLFIERHARNFDFQPGDFGYEHLGEFEPTGLLTSPFPHSNGYTFYVVYANARHERLLLRFQVERNKSVTAYEGYRYHYAGPEPY